MARRTCTTCGATFASRQVKAYCGPACDPARNKTCIKSWSTFLRNHGSQIWACDFLQTCDIFFSPIFAFFMVELGSCKVVHVAVTRAPTSLWTAQQLRNATPFGRGPRFEVATTSGFKGAWITAADP